METVSRAIFEDPFYLYVALGLAWVFVAMSWWRRRRRGLTICLLVIPAAAACVFATERLVVTDRERIIAAAEEIARDLEAGSLAAAEKYLDEKFGGHYGSKAYALKEGRVAIRRHKPVLVELSNVEVRISGRRAEMSVTTVIEPGAGELAGQRWPQSWQVHWAKVTVDGSQAWRITSVTPGARGLGAVGF